jgi:hypothetical protein
MYFIIREKVYNREKLAVPGNIEKVPAVIVSHTNATISYALQLLEDVVRDHILKEFGENGLENFQIRDIKNISEVAPPLVDGYVVYRQDSNPHTLLLYQYKTNIVPGWWSQTTQTQFQLEYFYSLIEYERIEIVENDKMEFKKDKKNQETINRYLSYNDLIKELENSQYFKNRKD